MRIGFISTVANYTWAGSEEMWWQTALLAIRAGHKVGCVVHSPMEQSDQITELQRAGAAVFIRKLMGHPRVTKAKERFSSALRQIRAWRPDAVVVSLGSPVDLSYWQECCTTLLNLRSPYILLLQFNADSLTLTGSQRELTRRLFTRSSHRVFVSQHNLELTQRQLANTLPDSSVILNPTRLSLTSPVPLPSTRTLTFGCVARLETRWKGHDILLECLSRPQWRSRDWRLNIYGSGPDHEYIEALIAHFGLQDRVRMCGYVRDMQEVWSECHIKVLASHGEGTPLAVLEAMMCGRPTITTDVGGNCEVLEDDVTGFIADAATPSSFGKTLERAWERSSEWAEMGQQAHLQALLLSEADPAGTLLTLVTAHA